MNGNFGKPAPRKISRKSKYWTTRLRLLIFQISYFIDDIDYHTNLD
jgi:hypothetical protein